MAGIWNQDFKKVVPEGASGTQAQRGIFYDDDRKRITRLTQAEGLEKSFNPESIERNLIGQESPSTEIKGYNESFGKDIIIKKGEPNFEFFNNFADRRPTGDNAKLRIYDVDFMKEESGVNHNKYLASSYMATVSVETANYTDGTISVNFTQDGDRVIGIMQRTDSSVSDDPATFSYGFVPSTQITITNIDVSDEEVSIAAGGEARVAVSFSPLGSPFDFTVESSDEKICEVKRWQQSVDIIGRSSGTAAVTIKSASGNKTAEIEVTVA